MSPAAPLIRTLALGSSAATAVVWRFRGTLRATVIVKATFEIVPSGVMRLVAPEEIVTAEINHGNSPLRSARLTSDLAPFLPGGDVVLTGHAHAPASQPVASLQTRLVVFEGDGLLVDKRIVVRGDTKDGQPQLFARMPLVYERAFGGIGFADNPLGVGADTSQRKPANLLSPDDPEAVACYAPVSRVMPHRRRLLKSLDRATLDKPVAEIPDDFEWAYFHVSPPGQRVPYLKGHERVVLEGMSAQHPRLASSLPGARASARVHGLDSEPLPVPLVADTLRIDTDAFTCTVVWRGSFTVPSEAALSALTLLAGVETATDAIPWPATLPEAETAPLPETGIIDEPTEARDFSRTSVIADTPASPALPFRSGAPGLPPRPAPRQTPPLPPAPPPRDSRPSLPQGDRPPSSRHTTTVDIAPPEETPHSLPFQRKVPVAAAPPAPRPVPAPLPLPVPAPASTTDPIELDSAEIEDVTFELVREPEILIAPSTARPGAPRSFGAPKAAPAPQGPALTHDPRFAVQLLPWGLSPSRDCLSILAKTTCDLIPGKPAEPCPAPDPLSGERSVPTDRGPVCAYPSDRVPFKPRADILLTGHAHSPGGPASPATSCEVVLRFGHPEAFIERRLVVFGNRIWQRGKAGPVTGKPEPFTRMPLSHDRAFGGPGFEWNPAGRGYRAPLRLSHDMTLPNMESPDRRLRLPTQKPEPACPGPIPEAWRARWGRLGREAPVFGALGDTLDWTLFQAAPRAQQLPHLRGDEPFEVTGAHSQHAKIAGSLPGIALKAQVTWKAGAGAAASAAGTTVEVPLVLDTVVIDTDEMKVHLVYRGVLGVADEKEPGIAGVKLVMDKVAG